MKPGAGFILWSLSLATLSPKGGVFLLPGNMKGFGEKCLLPAAARVCHVHKTNVWALQIGHLLEIQLSEDTAKRKLSSLQVQLHPGGEDAWCIPL